MTFHVIVTPSYYYDSSVKCTVSNRKRRNIVDGIMAASIWTSEQQLPNKTLNLHLEKLFFTFSFEFGRQIISLFHNVTLPLVWKSLHSKSQIYKNCILLMKRFYKTCYNKPFLLCCSGTKIEAFILCQKNHKWQKDNDNIIAIKSMQFISISIFLVQYSLKCGKNRELIHNTYFCPGVYETAHSKPIHYTAAWLELSINKANRMFTK